MPGKYSHSVVLADYSSRGIINLPPDQLSRYVESTPLSQKPSVSQLRLRGTRSAQAVYYHKSPGKTVARHSPLDDRHVSSNEPPVPPKHHLDVIIDDPGSNEFRPMRFSRYYEQQPRSSPMVNLAPQISQPELRSAYQRQQYSNVKVGSVPSHLRLPVQSSDRRPGVEDKLRSLVIREQSLSAGSKKNVGAGPVADQATAPPQVVVMQAYHPRPATVSPKSHKLLPHAATQRTNSTSNQDVDSDVSALFQGRSKPVMALPDEGRSQSGRGSRESPGPNPSHRLATRSRETLRSNHHESNRTRERSRLTPVLAEPDFDGFSDEPTGYFDTSLPPIVHRRNPSLDSTRPLQPVDTKLSKAVSTPNGDRSSPSRTTESSVQTSFGGHRSNSSVSSVDASNAYSHLGVSKHSFEGPRKTDQVSPADQSWRLPEIMEDHGFSPSIFEDSEGARHGLGLDTYHPEKMMGQVSSGKDVRFDNSDALSDISAALPPPITRFRDDEDEFISNMAKIFGDGGDIALNSKKGQHTIGRSANKKTKGFFSKFRTKS